MLINFEINANDFLAHAWSESDGNEHIPPSTKVSSVWSLIWEKSRRNSSGTFSGLELLLFDYHFAMRN